jgi:hypothetical protein
MKYVQARNGVFERHVHDVEPTQWDENNYCLARRLDADRAAMLGVHKLKIVTPPYFDPATQKRVEKDAVLVDGVWTQVYAVEQLTEEEAAASSGEWSMRVRAERDRRLAETDWWVSKAAESGDAISAEKQTYRQALRDVTAQEGFPYSVVWPAKPEETQA